MELTADAKIVIGVDPGPEVCSFVIAQVRAGDVSVLRVCKDADLASFVGELHCCSTVDVTVVFEMIESYGLAVGREVFETCVSLGQMMLASERLGFNVVRIGRPDIKVALCDSRRANDAAVREACMVRMGDVGTKKMPGPLYGVSGHAWAALAVVLAYQAGAKQFVYRKG